MVLRPSIAIVGNGCAAVECVKALRESRHSGAIHIFADNSFPPYNPTLTTYFAAGKITYDQLFPFGNADDFYRAYGLETHLDSPVTAIDVNNRIVRNTAGEEIRFDQCLIATGASPVLPPIPGIQSTRVLTMRSIGNAVRLKEAIAAGLKRAIVVGASVVGVKVVEVFADAGIEVCLADVADHVLPLAAHPDCAAVIEQRLQSRGVHLRLGAGIEAIEETSSGVRAYLKDSPPAESAELLVICIGVRPNVGFMDKKAIAVDRGILVDEHMRTNVEGIYAAGDVAQGRNLLSGERQLIGLWANARYQGRTAGLHMAGVEASYSGEIPNYITHFLGMTFASIGTTSGADHDTRIVKGDSHAQFFWRQGRLIGANLLDCDLPAGVIRHKLKKACTVASGCKLDESELFAASGAADLQSLFDVRSGSEAGA